MNNNYDEIILLQFISYATISFKTEISADKFSIDWGDGEVSDYEKEEYIDLKHNYKSEGLLQIKIAGTNISYLDVSHLCLIELELINCTALAYLNCTGNELCSLDLHSCKSLEEIQCNSNNLNELNIPQIHKISLINASYNNLEQLKLTNCNALQTLYCSNNKLQAIDLSTCVSINELNISYNQLDTESINSIFRQLPLKQSGDIPMISYRENPGNGSCDKMILSNKKWRG